MPSSRKNGDVGFAVWRANRDACPIDICIKNFFPAITHFRTGFEVSSGGGLNAANGVIDGVFKRRGAVAIGKELGVSIKPETVAIAFALSLL